MQAEYGIKIIKNLKESYFEAIVIAVGHQEFKTMGISNIRKLGCENCIIFDLKYLYPSGLVDLRL